MSEQSTLSKLKAAAKSATKALLGEVERVEQIAQQEVHPYDAEAVSVDVLLGTGQREARSRMQIYTKFHYMAQDGLISTALRQQVQMALGGHETTGETVFLDDVPGLPASHKKINDELRAEVLPFLNAVAHSVAFNAAVFGDGYARPYTKQGVGLTALGVDEVFTPLVQPWEQGGKAMLYTMSLGRKGEERLSMLQLARMKLPRMVYLPQMRAVENAQRQAILEDDLTKHPLLPGLIGGSLLEAAEADYDNLIAALRGMVASRIMGSVDETMLGVNVDGMPVQQRRLLLDSVEKMLRSMKTRAEQLVKSGQYSMSRHFHMIPVAGDKQVTQITSFQGSSASGTSANIDDVMFFARKLAGTLGSDLSQIGFSDQLTGGLGEGGFNRTSSQAAEKARILRTGMASFCDEVIDRHMLARYGYVFAPGQRTYKANFWGSIAALEAERVAQQERASNSTMILVQVLGMFKDLGLPKDAVAQVLEKRMQLDNDMAEMLSDALDKAKPAPGADLGELPPGVDDDEHDEGDE